MKKIVIIGAGNVGSHIVSASIYRKFSAEFILVDLCEEYEKAQYLDLKDALPFSQKVKISRGDLGDKKVSDGDIFIITAGAKQKEGQSRLDLLDKNTKILKDISEKLGNIKKTALVILVTNPVDLLVQKAQEIFDLNSGQIFGTGTLLDTARLKWRLSELKKDGKNIFDQRPEKIEAFVLGEHGDSSFIPWSWIKNSGRLSEEEKDKIEREVREEAYEIIEGKGATFFGIGAVTAYLLEVILRNKKEVLPLSVSLRGEYGFHNQALGLPAKVGKRGVIKIIEKRLLDLEEEKLKKSAENLKKFL